MRSPLIGCPVTRKTVQPLAVARLAPLSRQGSFYESSPSIGMVVDHGDSSHTCCRCIKVVPLWPGARVDLKEAGLYLKFHMCWTTPCLPTEAWWGLGCSAWAALPVNPRQHSRRRPSSSYGWRLPDRRAPVPPAPPTGDSYQSPEVALELKLWPPYCKCQRRPADPWRRRGYCALAGAAAATAEPPSTPSRSPDRWIYRCSGCFPSLVFGLCSLLV